MDINDAALRSNGDAERLRHPKSHADLPDDDAEEGEIQVEDASHQPPHATHSPYYGGKSGNVGGGHGDEIDDRWRPRSRSRSPLDRHRDQRRERHRSRERRRSRSRSRDRRHRRRDAEDDDDHRPGRRDRRRSPHRRERSHSRGRAQHEDKEARQVERDEQENDEEYQARVAAALAAQEAEDEDRIIEERRRRRQEILAKYKQQQQQQQPSGEPANGPQSAAPPAEAPSTVQGPQDGVPSGTAGGAEQSEDAIIAELGTEEGGDKMDIWRRDGPAEAPADASGVAAPSDPVSGIGEARDSELDRRVQAAAAARGAPPAGDESEDDMFAATPEDAKRAEQGGAQAAALPAGGATAPAGPRRGLVDSYDDAEGYYNFQVGELVGGRFEVVSASGRGVFSSVLRARDKAPGAAGSASGASAPPEVAIKVIRANDTMYKAGQTEKVILHKLAQADPDGKRHCIRLLGSFEYRHHLCLVFEPMDMDLRGLTKRYGRGIGLSLSAVRIYAQQMLVALQHLRNCGVLHADIKPDNILVNERRTVVKICDFGSAMFAGDNEITPYLVSRFYRAPEVILGLPYDHPMDMWSVGCVVYELFTGHILFPGKTNNEMLKLMMDVKGPFPKKMLKKAEFAPKHFESDPNMTFALLEEDPVTRRPVRRLLPNPSVKKDFAGLLAGQAPDKRKLTQLADLLERMMALDPDKRITPKEALQHPFIKEVPQAPRTVTGATVAAGK